MKYCSIFAQQSPRYSCKHARKYKELSEWKGYTVKCRKSRCSVACRQNWQDKHGACLARHLKDLPSELRPYRGNLTLHPGATPQDHRDIKARFLRLMKAWSRRTSHAFEAHGILHLTTPDEAHYDFVSYTDAPAKPFRQALSQNWVKAGGLRCSRIPMKSEEIDSAARYVAKAVKVDRSPNYLLRPRSELGLDLTWSTRGFWRGRDVDQIWTILIAEWLQRGDRSNTLKEYNNITTTDTTTNNQTYVPGDSVKRDKVHFAAKLPETPETAEGISDYAQRWGVSAAYMRHVLGLVPGAVCLEGWLDPVRGVHVYGAWYRDRSNTP